MANSHRFKYCKSCVHDRPRTMYVMAVILEIYHSCLKVIAFGHQWSKMEASLKLTRLISALGSWGFPGTLNYTSVMRKTNSLSHFSVEVFQLVQNRRVPTRRLYTHIELGTAAVIIVSYKIKRFQRTFL